MSENGAQTKKGERVAFVRFASGLAPVMLVSFVDSGGRGGWTFQSHQLQAVS